MLEGRANADIFSIWFAHVRLGWARVIILDAPIGQILWCARVEKVGRHFRHAFQVRDAPLRRNSYDWGNAYGISVRSFLWYNFDHLAWVAPVDGQLALVAPWPRSAIRLGKCWQHFCS